MTFFEYSNKLERLRYLAERKQTGTPIELAQKLEVSERTVQRMVQQLRDHGYPVVFNRYRFTYEVKE